MAGSIKIIRKWHKEHTRKRKLTEDQLNELEKMSIEDELDNLVEKQVAGRI